MKCFRGHNNLRRTTMVILKQKQSSAENRELKRRRASRRRRVQRRRLQRRRRRIDARGSDLCKTAYPGAGSDSDCNSSRQKSGKINKRESGTGWSSARRRNDAAVAKDTVRLSERFKSGIVLVC